MKKEAKKFLNSKYFFIFIILIISLLFIITALPIITITPPTLSNNSYTNNNWVFVNITSNEDLNQSLLEWGNSSGFSNVTMSNNSLTNWYKNMTNLVDYTYNYTIWAQNITGNWNQTERYFITVDRINPNINFTSPTPDNGSSQSENSVYVNVTTNDTNEHSAFIDWNRSLVGWWSFDSRKNATYIYDNSSYGNNGTVYGGANYTAAGKRGGAFEFDGIDDYVLTTNNINLTSNFTMSAWVIRYGGNMLYQYGGSGTLWAYTGDAFYTGSLGWQTGTALTPGIWYHVAVVGNGTNITLYQNGVVDVIIAPDNDTYYNNLQIYIGSTPSSSPFNGSIDEVMIWNRALSPEEINASYNAGLYKLYNNFTNLNDGTYNYKAYAIDAGGNTNQTEQRTVTITGDNEYPQFSNYWDNNASIVGNGTGYFNVTVTSTNGTVWLEIDGNNITATNLTANVYNASYYFSSSGVYPYRWHSWGNGTSENYNKSVDRNYTVNASADNTSPYFTNNTPQNQTITYNNTLSYDINATDDVGFDCFAVNDSRFKIDCNGFLENDTTLGVALYNLNITINDTSNNLNSTIMWVNVTKATSVVYTWLNNSRSNITINNNTAIWLNATLNTGDSGATLQLYNNGTLINSGSSPLENFTAFNATGLYNITTIYIESQNYTTSSETWWVNVTPVDTTNPTVNLVAPSNNSQWNSSSTVTFTYNVSDSSSISNCSLILNDTIDQTNSSITKDTTQTFSKTLSNANYNWSINCTDSANNIGASVTYNLSVNTSDIFASSCNQTDVQAAIDNASDGDTVVVPAGSCTWNVSVSIPSSKKITLQGAGMDSTIITRSPSGEAINLYQSGSRLTGFQFIDGSITVDGDGWRIDNCKIYSESVFREGVLGFPQRVTAEHPTGLIDHCNFTNTRVNVYGTAYSLGEGDQQHIIWAQPLGLGSGDNVVYVEDSTFLFTVFGNAIDSDSAGRYVFRYNTVNDVYIEAHSVQGNNRASRSWEIYNNTINQVNYTIYMPFRIRGGTGVVFNNTITGSFDNPNIGLDNVRSCEIRDTSGRCNGSSSWDGNTLGENGYPCRDQIGRSTDEWLWNDTNPYPPQALDPAYAWNNKLGENNVTLITIYCAESQAHIQENRDYYNNVEKPGYTPYYYPHPLVSGIPGVDLDSPSNNYLASNTTITFNCSAIDSSNLANITLYGNWSGWHANETQSVTGTLNTTTFTKTLSAGTTYIWNCYVCDNEANCRFGTANYSLTIDTNAPSISIVYPPNNSNFTTNLVNINYSVSDNPQSCWYSNSSGQYNYSITNCENITTQIWDQGNNTIIIYVNDSVGNENSSSVTFFVDSINPTIDIAYPANTTYATNISELNYTFTETNPQTCWWSNNSGIWNSSTQTCGTNWTSLTSTEGSNTWTVYINDTLGNENSSSITFTKDTIYPNITINSPLNQTYTTNSILFNITVIDNNIDSCLYSLDAGINNYSMSQSGNYWNDTNISMTQGYHTASFYCNDTSGNLNDSESVTFFIDSITPTINFTSPTETDGDFVSRNYIQINVSSSDSNLQTIVIRLYNSTRDLIESNSSFTSPFFINYTGLNEGLYYFNATANDSLGNENYTVTRNVTLDTTNSTVSLVAPSNNSEWNSSSAVTFTYNVSDSSSISNCSLILNDTIDQTNSSITKDTTQTFSKTLSNANYNWSINCTDSANNIGVSGTYNLSVNEVTPPNISLITPTNSSTWTSSSTVTFSYNVSDASSISNCSLLIDNSIDQTDITITKDTTQTFSKSLSNANYNWSVNCYDFAGNQGNSSVYYLTVSYTAPTNGGNGGGDGGATTTNITEETHLWITITPGNVTIMKDFDEEIGIKQIQIEVNNEAQNVKITVTKYPEKPANVSVEKTGKVYKYLQIETQNLEDKLNKSIITIQVEKNWTSENNVSKEDMSMFKFNHDYGVWNELTTTFTRENETYYYYDVELDSFSYFAIAGKVVEEPELEEEIWIKEKIRGIFKGIGNIINRFVEIIKPYWLWILIGVGSIVVIIVGIIVLLRIVKTNKKKYLGSYVK